MDTLQYHDPIKNLNTGSAQAGFRLDGQSGKYDSWMVQGSAYTKDLQDPLAFAAPAPNPINRIQAQSDYTGGFLQGQWTHSKSENGETVVRFSTDVIKTTYPYVVGTQHNTTFDVQKRFTLGEKHEISYGGGFQLYQDKVPQGSYVRFTPQSTVDRSGNVVVRDEWQVLPDRLMVSTGIRLDYSSYGHLEYEPSFRLLYTPSQSQSLWAAASRAVRNPNRFDHDITVDAGTFNMGLPLPLKTEVIGNPNLRSEVERSLEVGYRLQSGQRWSVDASAYWSRYDRLRLLEGPSVPGLKLAGQQPLLYMPMEFTNAGAGRNYGGEVWGYIQVTPTWRLTPEYSYLNETRWMPPAQTSTFKWDSRNGTVAHQGLLRSQHNLPHNLQFDLTIRARSRNTGFDLPGAVLVDARLGWRPFRKSEVSIAVEDATNRKVLESLPEGPMVAIPTGRSFTLKWTQRF
jgi:iron complex outermembrane receptor protein